MKKLTHELIRTY